MINNKAKAAQNTTNLVPLDIPTLFPFCPIMNNDVNK
jgi:hypothetical protein